jgi:hypothetical protein
MKARIGDTHAAVEAMIASALEAIYGLTPSSRCACRPDARVLQTRRDALPMSGATASGEQGKGARDPRVSEKHTETCPALPRTSAQGDDAFLLAREL